MKNKVIALLLFLICGNLYPQSSVGIGTNSPDNSAILHINSQSRGLLVPTMTNSQRNAILAPADGLIVYNTTTSEINYNKEGYWHFPLTSGYWVGGGSGQMFNIGDNIGINTAGPTERLDVNGNIRTNGSMNIDNTSAIMQLKSGGDSKGFVQLSAENLRLGTNSGNTAGDAVFRLNGTDRVFIDEVGRLGINESNPTSRLHVNGDVNVTGNAVLSNYGDLTTSATGSCHMLPRCFGMIAADGAIISGTPNFTVTKGGPGAYYVNTAMSAQAIVIVTCISQGFYVRATTGGTPGNFGVVTSPVNSIFWVDAAFNFIVFDP
ncbi:MAG: hypothetical protein AB9834_12985 [Lentimicrobium sp.]